MLGKWPIRVKVLIGLGLLLLVVTILFGSGLYTSYAYRGLVRALRSRVGELPVAADLSRQVGELRLTLGQLRGLRTSSFSAKPDEAASVQAVTCRNAFRDGPGGRRGLRLPCIASGWKASSARVRGWPTIRPNGKPSTKSKTPWFASTPPTTTGDWMLDLVKIGRLEDELIYLQELAAELPSHLHEKLENLSSEVRGQYRAMIVGTWIASVVAALILALFVKLFYQWVFQPLQVLIAGSRRVAGGEFDHRIRLDTDDEMAELADAMNDMTARFRDIRDDLDHQVRERTRQVVRSEQLASVGFLAAGVAHEINNPLASIALCAESLESRVLELLDENNENHAVIGNYLRMIQSEAFRCKEITEKLLDFSRMGEVQRQRVELGELVQGVIDMIGHLGKYRNKKIEFTATEPVVAAVNGQEIKQVVLNLMTNALDSFDQDGVVRVELARRGGFAELTFTDNGCGMPPDVLTHIFEPFFTRRRSGQGTGLGLSITYRIVAEHGGEIHAHSSGKDQGSTFRVRLPLVETEKEIRHRHQAA